jgi:hypothetical protein
MDCPTYSEKGLLSISSNTEIGFTQFDLDKPVPPDLTTDGERGVHAWRRPGRAPDAARAGHAPRQAQPRIRTPQQVARSMEEIGSDSKSTLRDTVREL